MANEILRYVNRDRLVAQLLAGRVGVVEASAGFGKSVLASQLRQALGWATVYVPLGSPDAAAEVLIASLRRVLRSARLSDLLTATDVTEPGLWVERLLDVLADTPEGVLLILDDAHHVRTDASASLVMRLARGLPTQHRILIAARSLHGLLEPLGGLESSVYLDTRALAFTTDEAAALLRAQGGPEVPVHEVEGWVESTQGWATALVVAAAAYRADGGRRPGPRAVPPDLIAGPMRRILAAMHADDRRAVTQLAHLPFFSAELCDAVGGDGALERIVSAGVPVARTDSGWWELPSPVADHLASQAPVVEATAQTAADVYARGGETLAAIRVLLAAGLMDEAASRLAAVSPAHAEQVGLAVVREIVETLPEPAVAAHPRVLLHLARVAEVAHQMDLRSRALAEAAGLASSGRSALGRELDAERARDLMWDERTRAEAELLAGEVITHAGAGELVARARALDVLGRLGTWFSEGDPRPEAEAQLEQSARLARRAGQRTWAAQALIPLAMGVYFATCRYDRALAVLSEALGDLPARHRYRAMVQTFRAELLIELARYSEAEACFAEMREIGAGCGEEWIPAYVSWGEANLASYRGDADGTVRAVVDVERHRDDWYEQPSGVEFLAQAADYLDRVGEHERAIVCLDRARRRMEGSEHHVRVYSAAVQARSGDPLEAERAIAELLARGALEPQERWPVLLLRAHAALRREDPAAGELAALAFDTCLELGHPSGPLIREPSIADALLPLAVAAGSKAAAALLQQTGALLIRLLGGFEITRAGRRVTVPPGRPSKAVRAVAVAGGRVQAEELMELLWPGIDPTTGRSRLRNLLHRLHTASGELLVREGQLIALVPGGETDVQRFEAELREALAARSAGDADRAAVKARSAIERYRGELLPEDRYEPWAAGARERLCLSYLELLDLLAADCARRQDVDEAIRLIQHAINAEPNDEERYVQLARLLASQGRAGSALAALRQARAMLETLWLEPSPALVELERSLGAGAPRPNRSRMSEPLDADWTPAA
jgi:ATP/maltotriose-dependent transcriptional regulator MalT/DNA-binding SARP family transcriptional activator